MTATKKIIVIGSSGQLGKEFKNDYFFNDQFNTSYISRNECDITDHLGIEKIVKNSRPWVVINCAAYTNVDNAENEKTLANKVNNHAVENLAKLSKKYDFILIHFSTDYVFNQNYQRPFKEFDRKNPVNFYGITKSKGEEQIINYAKKFFIFRISWVYGQYGNNFPKTIIKLIKKQNELNVVNDQVGVPTSTKFIVDSVKNILKKKKINEADFSIYNCTPKGQCTWHDIASKILEKYKNEEDCICRKIIPVSSDEFITIAERPSYSLLDNGLILKKFNLKINDWSFYLDEFLHELKFKNF